jgi:tetratricopeptide (TPR) repeat protein
MDSIAYGNETMLLLRLRNSIRQHKKISILVGSGLTAPDAANGNIGVSTVREIVSDIKHVFVSNECENVFLEKVKEDDQFSEQYQNAMHVLLYCFGQDYLNKIIGSAVLNALSNKTVFNSDRESNPKLLEKHPDNWFLRPGVDALGETYVDFPEVFAGPILTSNFDPLIEISIRKHNGNPNGIILVNDGKFLNQVSDNIHSVVHFHGYWSGSDTLHTPDQLKRERSQLKGDLKTLLNDSLLLVIGYGGWNDVFTNTLLGLIAEGNSNFDVLWTFYDRDDDIIRKNYSHILDRMTNSLGQRVTLYKGIDCDAIFPALLNSLNNSNSRVTEKRSDTTNKDEVVLEAKTDNFPCDVPPHNFYWVGRKKELRELADADYKTYFITGIGGQGKSGLASHFVKNLKPGAFEMWDWRDCKDEDHKLQTIILSQIERLSKGVYRASKLCDEKLEDLIHLFFEVLGSRRIVFVYDNVDRYIDLEEFRPVAGLEELIKRIYTYKHRSVFLFTCRPHVSIQFNDFREIQLKALSEDETIHLFQEYTPPIQRAKLTEIAIQSHNLTNGHPLWINLIAAHAKRGEEAVQVFLESYISNKAVQKNNPNYTLAENTLDVVWRSLNTRQQTLLRGLSEMVTALTKDELSEIFKSEITLNQFNKCFNVLNSLNLLVIKSADEKEDLIELHPLVKEYIQYKYKPNERQKFIMLFVEFYNQLILLIKPTLDADSPLSYFEKYTQKAELEINNKDFKAALTSIHEVSDMIHSAGFTEEYTRVARILFDRIDWFKAVAQEYIYFHDEFYSFVRTLTEKGKYDFVEELLEKYKNVIPGKSKAYISYCNLQCYYYWFRQRFQQAIEWGERGAELTKTGVGSTSDIEYNLALALRDTKNNENIERALTIFLKGETIEGILNGTVDSIHFSSPYFGNIGRCLWFQQRVEDSLFFFYKSLSLLLKEKETNTVMNQGYAGLWIFEALFKMKRKKEAIYFLKFCLNNWDRTAPIKAKGVRKAYTALLHEKNTMQKFQTLSNWEIESHCKKFVEEEMKKY